MPGSRPNGVLLQPSHESFRPSYPQSHLLAVQLHIRAGDARRGLSSHFVEWLHQLHGDHPMIEDRCRLCPVRPEITCRGLNVPAFCRNLAASSRWEPVIVQESEIFADLPPRVPIQPGLVVPGGKCCGGSPYPD